MNGRIFQIAAIPVPLRSISPAAFLHVEVGIHPRPAQAFGIGQDGGAERMEFVAFAVPRELMENPAPGV